MGAPKGNNFNPMGRPHKEVNWEEFEKLCALQCSQEEIAGFLKLYRATLSEKVKKKYKEDYSTVYKRFSEAGKVSLRRHQFLLSKKNAAMAIWLGKQWLGQKDHEDEKEKTAEMNPHLEMVHQLLNENKMLKEKLNAIKSEANSELSRSNTSI